jgi:hypothetical protein
MVRFVLDGNGCKQVWDQKHMPGSTLPGFRFDAIATERA